MRGAVRQVLPSGSAEAARHKVCVITTVPLTLETFFLDPAAQLHEENGCDVTLVCDESPSFAARVPGGLNYVGITMGRGLRVTGLSAVTEMYRLFRRERFDLVQYATPNASLYASIAASAARVPVRLYCQCGIRYASERGALRALLKALERLTCWLSTDVRVASHGNRAAGIADGLYPSQKAYVLGAGGTIGVDLAQYPLEEKRNYADEIRGLHELNHGFVYGFVGRFTRDKGVYELLAAFRDLMDQGAAAFLLCVGPDETEGEHGTDLLKWAKESDRVVFTGHVQRADMPKYFAAMDCLVAPSHREGFGMVLQEAGAMALPIITTDIPGASEVMESGISCLLVPPGDAAALQHAMTAVYDEEPLRSGLGSAARARVELCFERRGMLARQQLDYVRLLGGR